MAASEQLPANSATKAEKQTKETAEAKDWDPESPVQCVVEAAPERPATTPQADEARRGKENEKKKLCCTRRTIFILIGVVVVLAIAVPIVFIQVIPAITKSQALDSLDLSDASRRIFKELGTFVAVIAAVVGNVVADSEPFTQDDLRTEDIDLGWVASTGTTYGWSPSAEPLQMETLIVDDTFSYEIITEDDKFGEDTGHKFAKFLTDEKYIPFKDSIKFLFDDEEVLDEFLVDMKMLPKGLDNGYLHPIPPHKWYDQTTDEAISRIFWYGYGAVLIMGPEFSELYNGDELTGFQIDLDISTLEVREGFRPYGFRIQFDVDQNVVSIYDPDQNQLFTPGDGQLWEEAKFLVRVTVITVVTAREHLLWSHLTSSNTMARAMTVHLPPNHPLRRMLSVFTFNTNNVNSDAMAILTPERGWVHRMTSFTYGSMVDLFATSAYKTCDIFEPFKDEEVGPGLQRVIDAGRFPYYTEGVAYYQVVKDFVTDWLARSGEGASDAYALAFYEEIVNSSKGMAYEVPPYSPDNFIDIVSQMIWVVTAYHEVVGTVVEYAPRPDYSGMRAVYGKATMDAESYVLGLYLIANTGLTMPLLIADYENFIGKGDGIPAWEIEVWASFQDALRVQSDIVQADNVARIANGQPEFNLMDPANFESAISL